jgi:sensor histidine kinase YesM
MSRQKTYWYFQLAGWTALTVNEIINYLPVTGFTFYMLLEMAVNISLGILLTHNYRRLAKHWGWIELPFMQLVPRLLLAILVMAAVMTAVNVPLDAQIIVFEDQRLATINALASWSKYLLVWTLIYHMFHYFERRKEIEVDKIRIESSAKETEAKVLRAQLNPHFMFNALNSIRALILEDPDRAQKGITQLSNILRSSLLADRRRTVSLGEELRTVDDYLALEKIRYEDRLEVRKNIYPETLSLQVPPMMLQTLVENAIKHGVSKPVKGGFVSVEAQVRQGALHLCISNTGVLETTESGGFGLENTAHRLELLFGFGASFRIYQASENVVCAEVLIPVETAVEAARAA